VKFTQRPLSKLQHRAGHSRFAPFALKEGTNFMEYDLVYLKGDLLFWGARNIDGRGFDTEQTRPTNLQIPLIRK
jgi:hypothetical protein